eukprot:CAMPEP_0201569712 /NCGR_PEP_ID=MMETSP0190_2-20130828/11557_1 /ASSEMBLY_ACC=CAM_ASM_000263 /TAXON_ID=37353 /ORGANISM="Rosalina sp." /LENGTH=349 /DNA_ID=CAMNT_0047992363 /DNA_START=20 /DNA_END=1066 /DNA_ORIENTATION=+
MAANQPEENQPLKEEDNNQDNDNAPDPEPQQPQQPEQQPQAQNNDINNQAAQPTPQNPNAAASGVNPSEEPGGRQKDAQDYVSEVGDACNKCYNWFPIGLFGFIGGILLIVCCIIDLFATNLTFTQFFVIALLICGGLIMILVEMPVAIVKKQQTLKVMQLALYDWLKLLSRMWGRGIFSIVLVVMCFSEMGGGFRSLPWIAGMYYAALIVLYFIFGLLAAKKYNGIYVFISNCDIKTGTINVNLEQNDNVEINVGIDDDNKEQEQQQQIPLTTDTGSNSTEEILRKKFGSKFDELDTNGDGLLTRADIARLGVEASLELSNSECHAIFTYLDDDCNGDINKDNWVTMW